MGGDETNKNSLGAGKFSLEGLSVDLFDSKSKNP
jgi:hypothetical protein